MNVRINKLSVAKTANEAVEVLGDSFICYKRMIDDEIVVHNCLILKMLIDVKHDGKAKEAYICKILKRREFCVVLKEEIEKVQLRDKLTKKHFGVEYVDHQDFYNKLNKKQFELQFKEELEKDADLKEQFPNIAKEAVDNLKTNIDYFKSLNHNSFEKCLKTVVDRYYFKEVTSLEKDYSNCLYIMVFDEYSQFYIGKTTQYLEQRICNHWSSKIVPWRFFWGEKEYSRISVDTFKRLDCTRIFVATNIKGILSDSSNRITVRKIEETNCFFTGKLEDMSDLEIAERIVINNSPSLYCLSDRVFLPNSPIYSKINKSMDKITIYDFIKAK